MRTFSRLLTPSQDFSHLLTPSHTSSMLWRRALVHPHSSGSTTYARTHAHTLHTQARRRASGGHARTQARTQARDGSTTSSAAVQPSASSARPEPSMQASPPGSTAGGLKHPGDILHTGPRCFRKVQPCTRTAKHAGNRWIDRGKIGEGSGVGNYNC